MRQRDNKSANTLTDTGGQIPRGHAVANEGFLSHYPAALLTHIPSIVCLLFIVGFAVFFSTLALQQHRTFQTNGLDLGNVDQALWNTGQGRFLQFTLMTPVESRLALHVEPILLFFVPLYWLNLGSPEVLLIIQACVVALGAWPLYQIAKSKFQITEFRSPLRSTHHIAKGTQAPRPTRYWPFFLLVFPLAYLLLPTLQSAVLFDFHAVTLASTFLLFAFWALVQRKDKQFIIFLLLAMACKEDMPLVVAMVGLYVGLAQRRWRLAGLVIGLSGIWFVVAVFVIQPYFSPGGNIQLDRYAWLGDRPVEMIKTVITQPRLIFNHLWYQADLPGYLTQLFFPTAYLALISPLTLLPILPSLAINLLSDNPFSWRLEDFHYGAPLAPFLFISAIYGIRLASQSASRLFTKGPPSRLRAWVPMLATLFILLLFAFSAVYHYYRGFTPLARPFRWPQMTAHHHQLQDLLQTVPDCAALFTQSNLAPHLTHRRIIYGDFGYFTDPDFPAPAPVDRIWLDVTAFENIGGLHQFLRQTFASRDYQVALARDGVLHILPLTADKMDCGKPKMGYHLSSLPPAFYTFTRPDPPPVYQLPIDFGDVIRLRGYTLHFNRQEEVQVSVDLEPLQPLTGDIQPVLYLLDASGQVIGATTDLQPSLVWFSPDQWPVGETVRVRFNTLPWYTRETENYGLALGLVEGNDVWNVSQRYRPTLTEPTEFATHLPADGTLVELARMAQVWGMPEGGPVARLYSVPRIPQPLAANFDNQIKLLGHTAPEIAGTEAGQALTFSLYWQAVNPPETLTRFVQLVGPDGLIYGQNDSTPDNGNYPTYLWQSGEVVPETVTLPIQDGPSGDYTLHIGLYRPDTGQRLPLMSGGDHVEILVE